jgi:hypothetical protein
MAVLFPRGESSAAFTALDRNAAGKHSIVPYTSDPIACAIPSQPAPLKTRKPANSTEEMLFVSRFVV